MLWASLRMFNTLLLIVSLQESSAFYTITECNEDEPLYIVENQPTSITCKGLGPNHNMYWSITELCGDCKETRIGLCATCRASSPCQHNCSHVNADYIISRTGTESMLRFVENQTAKDGATVKCSQLYNQTQANCAVTVIKAYQLPDCKNNTLDVVANGKTSIRCTDIDSSHNMYWSIIYADGEKKTVAECELCLPVGDCPTCTSDYQGYTAERSPTSSTLQLESSSDSSKDGATVRCAQNDRRTEADCKIQVFEYRLPQCKSGQLDLSEVPPWTSIMCEDLRYDHNMKWTVTDKHDVIEAASCLNKNKPYNCTAKDGFTATRANESTSELKITKNIREQANKALTCLRGDNAAAVKCLIRVVYPGELENPSVSIDSNFTVSGRVDISKVFASDSNVACHWYYTQRDHPQLVSSTKLSLVWFTDNDLHYQRGVCNMTMQLNTSESADDFTVVVQPGHGPVSAGTVNITFHVNQEHDSRFPVATVAGSVAGCVFIAAVVIVIAVIVKRERPKAEEVTSTEEATPTANGAADTYYGLHMQDVGLPSVYSEMGQRPVNAASDADYIDLYHGLDMSEVGQRAEYSQLGQDT